MIYTIRTFHVHRKDYAEFVRFSEEQIWPAIEKKGARALGLWVVAIGGPERIFLMTRYDSHGHWEETRNWDNLANEGSGRAALVHETECISLLPLTQRQPDSDAPEKEPGIYTLRSFKVAPADVSRFVDLSENQWWPWVTRGEGVRPIGQWITKSAPEERIYMMTRYDSLYHWEGHHSNVGTIAQPDDPEMGKVWEIGQKAIQERKKITIDTNVKVLRPITSRRP
ncbi:MAG: NIPSNAP family protein [Gemmatimonadetes bacterium]|nr:NIPSNAP family protein [Gemmatimonadota bacterium]